MALTDPLADMLTIIRNAVRAGLDQTQVKRSKLTMAVLDVLKSEQFIYDHKSVSDTAQGHVRVYLKAPEGLEGRHVRKILNVRKMSKPGLRVYTTAGKIPRVLNGLGVSILTTSRGVMTGREAKRRRVGGEILVNIW